MEFVEFMGFIALSRKRNPKGCKKGKKTGSERAIFFHSLLITSRVSTLYDPLSESPLVIFVS